PDSLAKLASRPGPSGTDSHEVRDCYSFTRRTAVYSKFEARLGECPVMASIEQLRPGRQSQDSGIGMESNATSITYQTSARDRPLTALRVHRSAGEPCRGWLTADGWTVPVALGRGGILANKREGDGGTPRGI